MLYEAALAGIASLNVALRHLGELRNGRGGIVSVTTGGVTVRHFMASAITTFRRRHPDVALEFRSAYSTRRCIEPLHDGQIDLAWITLGQPLPGIQQRPVLDLPWVLAVHADDPLAARDSISPRDLAAIRYLAYPESSTSRQRLEDNLTRLGIGLPAPTGIADWDTAILLAELGVGHAILPALPGITDAVASLARTVPIPALDPLTVGWAARQWSLLTPWPPSCRTRHRQPHQPHRPARGAVMAGRQIAPICADSPLISTTQHAVHNGGSSRVC